MLFLREASNLAQDGQNHGFHDFLTIDPIKKNINNFLRKIQGAFALGVF